MFCTLGRIDTQPLFEILEILPVNDILLLEVGKFMFKRNNNLLPVTIANFFEHFNHPQNRLDLIRNQEGVVVVGPFIVNRLSLGERSIQHRGPTMWHGIPDSIKLSESASAFKRQLKKHLLPHIQ